MRGGAAYFYVIEWTYMYIVTEEIKYTTSNGKILPFIVKYIIQNHTST